MSSPITFSYEAWVARYPEFSGVPQTAAQGYFDEATIYLRNDGTSPISTTALQAMLLNMLTAHIAALYAAQSQRNGGGAPGLVGRISDAAEGSVSVSTDMGAEQPGSAAWFQQTPYGASYWQATAQYRTARYRAGPRRVFNAWPIGYGQ